jgi:hypothetical protein
MNKSICLAIKWEKDRRGDETKHIVDLRQTNCDKIKKRIFIYVILDLAIYAYTTRRKNKLK